MAVGMAGDIEYCSIDNATHDDTMPNRMCPKCDKQEMRKISLLRLSDIIFDYCPECGGMFLDKREAEAMNRELRELSGDGINDEIRQYVNGHLLRVDKISGAALISRPQTLGLLGGATTTTLRVTLYYKSPLGLGLRITKESWVKKIEKLFGLFHDQDIEVGNGKMDSAFIIQGKEMDGIKKLFNSEKLQQELLEFVKDEPRIHLVPGTIEVLDTCVVYTEGPYSGEFKIDMQTSSKDIIERLQRIVEEIESQS